VSFTAAYAGTCAACLGRFEPGTEVIYDLHDELVHVTCPPTELDAPAGVGLCTNCFCYHAGECA
jgi:hypothetical protein